MTKQEFLTRLKTKLSLLSSDEIQDILDEYAEYINDKIAEGKTEAEAVHDFGDVDELASEILKAYKINDSYSKKDEWTKQASAILNDIANFLTNLFTQAFDGMSTRGISNIIVLIFTAILMCLLLRIPFWIIELLGDILLSILLPGILETIFVAAWKFLCAAGYLVFAIGMIVNLVKNGEVSFDKGFTYTSNSKTSPRQRKVIDAEYREKH